MASAGEERFFSRRFKSPSAERGSGSMSDGASVAPQFESSIALPESTIMGGHLGVGGGYRHGVSNTCDHTQRARAEMWHATRSHVACVRTIGLFLCRVIWRRGSRAGTRREWWGEGKRRRGQQVVVRSLGRGRREAQVLRRRQKQPSVSGGVTS